MISHFTHPYILNPQHKITVNLIGMGGTGSQVLSSLARIHKGLEALGHTGIHVKVYDFDTVSEANLGRQLFSPSDLNLNKAVAAVSRVNRFFGYQWEAHSVEFNEISMPANITISCVDSAAARIKISAVLKAVQNKVEPYEDKLYWLDFGNSRVTGQAILGTLFDVGNKHSCQLLNVHEAFDLSIIKEEDQGPSCSLAEAIGRQDLFINSTLANLGCNLLWKLFTDGKIDYHGLYLNLETMQTRPIKIAAA
jgi:PRTRC genetic system ThiF family protein